MARIGKYAFAQMMWSARKLLLSDIFRGLEFSSPARLKVGKQLESKRRKSCAATQVCSKATGLFATEKADYGHQENTQTVNY
jgi:hypothetical protein